MSRAGRTRRAGYRLVNARNHRRASPDGASLRHTARRQVSPLSRRGGAAPLSGKPPPKTAVPGSRVADLSAAQHRFCPEHRPWVPWAVLSASLKPQNPLSGNVMSCMTRENVSTRTLHTAAREVRSRLPICRNASRSDERSIACLRECKYSAVTFRSTKTSPL